MRVLITGASGFLGAHLARAHVAAGDDVIALRHSKPLPSDLSGRVEELRGDLHEVNPATWPRGSVVYHCAAVMADQLDAPYEAFKRINVEGTAHILRASRAAKAERVVHVSSVGVLGPTRVPTTESAPYGRCLTNYERSKMEAEGVAHAAMREGLPVVIVRPAQLYGPGMRHMWPRLIQGIARGRMPIVGRGTARIHLTHVEDVIQGLRLAATMPRAVGQVYHLAAASPITVRQAFESIAEALGVPRPRTVPLWPLLAAATILERFPAAWRPGWLKIMTRHYVTFFTRDHVYAIEKAKAELGYRPTQTWERTIVSTVAWYQQEEHRRQQVAGDPQVAVGASEVVA